MESNLRGVVSGRDLLTSRRSTSRGRGALTSGRSRREHHEGVLCTAMLRKEARRDGDRPASAAEAGLIDAIAVASWCCWKPHRPRTHEPEGDSNGAHLTVSQVAARRVSRSRAYGHRRKLGASCRRLIRGCRACVCSRRAASGERPRCPRPMRAPGGDERVCVAPRRTKGREEAGRVRSPCVEAPSTTRRGSRRGCLRSRLDQPVHPWTRITGVLATLFPVSAVEWQRAAHPSPNARTHRLLAGGITVGNATTTALSGADCFVELY
jgi:hypothetical protein